MLVPNQVYRPLSLFNQWEKEMERWLKSNDEETSIATSRWTPAVDIKEEETRFLIHADIPGVDPKDIDITVEQGMLTLRGERNEESEEERKNYKRTERIHGSFYRRFSLPDSADMDNISATGKNGVLEVVIPKQEVAQPRRISVTH